MAAIDTLISLYTNAVERAKLSGYAIFVFSNRRYRVEPDLDRNGHFWIVEIL